MCTNSSMFDVSHGLLKLDMTVLDSYMHEEKTERRISRSILMAIYLQLQIYAS